MFKFHKSCDIGIIYKFSYIEIFIHILNLNATVSNSVPDPGCLYRSPGSKFFIPDPGQKVPGSGSASKNLIIFNPKNCFQALRNMIRDVHPDPGPDFFPSRVQIPDADPGPQGKKKTQKAPDPGSGTLVLKHVTH
jgi:hypothetical protein